MPIQFKKKKKQGDALVVEGTAQLVDEMSSLDEPEVLKSCSWVATLESGQVLWNIEIVDGDDLRGYIQAELQKRTKKPGTDNR
jgi:hypothetical protein